MDLRKKKRQKKRWKKTRTVSVCEGGGGGIKSMWPMKKRLKKTAAQTSDGCRQTVNSLPTANNAIKASG